MSDASDLEGMLELFYQCPVGLIETRQDGTVERINPAAARMLIPALEGDEHLERLHPLLARLAPGLLALIAGDPDRLGRLGPGHRIEVAGGRSGSTWIELLTTRLGPDRIMTVLIDVSEERRLAQREHEMAVELQQAMLGRIDPVTGLALSVTYRTADEELHVGGDWYDVIELPEGKAGLVIGDVVGHDVKASAAMGQLRSAIRSMAPWCPDPAELVNRADRIASDIDGAECATMTYAVLDSRTGSLVYSNAGHPPPLLLNAGSAEYLTGGHGPPLACGWLGAHEPSHARLTPGDAIVMYTDGLIERRGEHLDVGLHQLRATAATLYLTPAAQISELLATEMLDDQQHLHDDLCVLAVRYLSTARPSDQAETDILTQAEAVDPGHPGRAGRRRDRDSPQHVTFVSRPPHPTAPTSQTRPPGRRRLRAERHSAA